MVNEAYPNGAYFVNGFARRENRQRAVRREAAPEVIRLHPGYAVENATGSRFYCPGMVIHTVDG